MKRNFFFAVCLVLLSGSLAGPLPAQSLGFNTPGGNQQGPPFGLRIPRGIYAVVNVEKELANEKSATPPLTTALQLNSYFDNLYKQMLADPAISGITLQVHWDTLNPNPPGSPNSYDWTYVDLAFFRAWIWNFQNPGAAPKTIQLIVTPGFQSPDWLFDELPSCDLLFSGGTPPSDCGKATFAGFQEAQDHNDLPLPWNPVYKAAWRNFLKALADRYLWSPTLVAISIDGPTAASAEIILPSDSEDPSEMFGGVTLTPNEMWNELFAFQSPALPKDSDQVFVVEWNNATDMFGEIFKGITLTIATGNGLPDFNPNATFTIPPPFGPACPNPDADCLSQALILSHFIDPKVDLFNAKGTQTSGMEAGRANPTQPPHDMGIAAVKSLSLATANLTFPTAQILGGAQFNTSFSNAPNVEGCLDVCAGKISPEQSEYNVLYVYFYGSPVASVFGGVNGEAPLNYLQIYSDDILYAEANMNSPQSIMQIDGTFITVSAQDLMNLASRKLLSIAEGPRSW